MADELILDKLRMSLDELRRDNPGKTFYIEGETVFYKRPHQRQPVPVMRIVNGKVRTVYTMRGPLVKTSAASSSPDESRRRER